MADSKDQFVQGVGESDPNAIPAGFVTDTSDGSVLTGVQPGARPSPVQVTPEYVVNPGGNTSTAAPTQDPNVKYFTEEDLEKARKQEKDKLYSDLEETKKALKEMEKRDRDRVKKEEEAQKVLQDAEQKKVEEEMEVRQLLEAKTQQFQDQLAQEREERERLAATLDMERQFVALSQYRNGRVEQERESILPELIDLVAGNSEEEIEQSIVSLRQRSEAILGNVQAATNAARQQMAGASVTAPPVGPMETQETQQTLTPEEIRNMDINTYAQNRDRLLGAVHQNVRQGGIYNP